MLTIFEMRSYVRAKGMLDSAKKQSDVKMTPAVRRVLEVEIQAIKDD